MLVFEKKFFLNVYFRGRERVNQILFMFPNANNGQACAGLESRNWKYNLGLTQGGRKLITGPITAVFLHKAESWCQEPGPGPGPGVKL